MNDSVHMTMDDLLGHSLNDVESKFSPTDGVFCIGSMEIPLPQPRVAVIGSREASKDGLNEARKITEFLTTNNTIVVSGLARGIDTVSHETAINCGGRTIAVLGTPLNRTYPKENIDLYHKIIKDHLAISQYPTEHNTTPRDFVLRNRTMAIISDASIIVDAGESSGSLHQGWESLRIGRSLFISERIMKNERLEWPKKMVEYGAMTLVDLDDILENIPSHIRMPKIV